MSGSVAWTIYGWPVHWYGLLIMLGAVGGIALASARERRLGLPRGITVDLALVLVPSAIVGARLYYVAFTWHEFAGNPLRILQLWTGGMAIYGAVLGGALAALIYARAKRLSFARLADLIAPALALGQAVGRWGNFVNQEAYGVSVANPAHAFFPLAVFIEADAAWHYATFFYESVWCALTALILVLSDGRRRRAGDALLWYMLLYGAERVAVEGLRTDSLYLGPVRISQALSLAAMLVAFAVFVCRWRAPLWARIAAWTTGALGAAAVIRVSVEFERTMAGGAFCSQLVLLALLLLISLMIYRKNPREIPREILPENPPEKSP